MPKKTTRGKATLSAQARNLVRGFALHNVNRHLRAYVFDRNPRHVTNAWMELRALPNATKHAPDLRDAMDELLACVLSELRRGAGKRPREQTVRDLEVYHEVRALERSARAQHEVPKVSAYLAVAKAHRLSISNVKQIMRKVTHALNDSTSDLAPRAFK